jgi:hypothetical protein
MSAKFKPGDRVRDKRTGGIVTLKMTAGGLWFVEECDGYFPTEALEPAPAAPAAEPEMRKAVASLRTALSRVGITGSTVERMQAVPLAVDALEVVIARHDAERDARIAELEAERDEARRMVEEVADLAAANLGLSRQDANRARAAEAALAELQHRMKGLEK